MNTTLVKTADGEQGGATLTWRVDQPITAAPAFLHFGTARAGGEPARRRLLLRTTRDKPFRVLSVEGGDNVRLKSANVPSLAAEDQWLDLHFLPTVSAPPGMISGVIRVATDDRRQAVVRVPWTAIVDRPETGGDGKSPQTTFSTLERRNI